MYINHNGMASNVANTLTSHYSNLATSTQRLSSGLRVNSAADDAAGLAIRELMRADIASLNQGVRNANDAISMIQTADGALGIIDEKLIRMKELAEQAATGTYDSTQRLMIESEYQAMASEITRIANSTDFNGMKLLDGTLQGTHDGSKMTAEGAMKIHFGTGNDSAEDYYYVEIDEMTAQALGLGNASTWQDVQERGTDAFKKSLTDQIKTKEGLTDADRSKLLANVDKAVENLNTAISNATDYKQAFKYWNTDGDTGFMTEGKNFAGNSSLMADYLEAASEAQNIAAGPTAVAQISQKIQDAISAAAPTDSEVAAMWPKDGNAQDIARVQNELWNKVSTAAKDAAKEAGLYDDEIKQLMGDLETVWKTAANIPNPAVAAQTMSAAVTKLKTQANATLTKQPSDIGTDDSIGLRAQVRNEAKLEYANAAIDKKPAAGPTDADQLVGQLSNALKNAWDNAAKDAFNVDGSAKDHAVQVKAHTDAMAAFKKDAIALGLTEAEADTLIGNFAAPAAQVATKTAWDDLFDDGAGAGYIADIKDLNDTQKGGTLTNSTKAEEIAVRNQGTADAKANDKLEQFWNGLRDTEKQKLQYAWGQAAMYNLANAKTDRDVASYGIGASFSFQTTLGLNADGVDINMIDNDMLANALKTMQDKVGHMDFAGYTIETQEDAQQALDAINDAITQKDKTRAHLGALQNRLENTVSNLTIQAENLQSAESRISDVDVATEMTNFVRNQILTQSAVAMLSQANSMPQMAMQLIG